MISDVLFDAVTSIDEYLADDWYQGEGRVRILCVRAVMDAMREELDDPAASPRPIVDRCLGMLPDDELEQLRELSRTLRAGSDAA
jgi:hypothetical protein